eukprot:Anaeramoba_ignava/c18238_g2_i2.p1 GENE.c18238_g2_i2~~c18238_g2_i2.p1  ORF type:complete len:197 (+),score=54.09 c18238_g2_i2:76-666(+)
MEDNCRIVILGAGSVGKSCLTLRYLQNKFITDYDPTIEENYRKMVIVDGKPMLLEILDTAGQDEYRSIRDKYFRSGDGFLIVYSITSPQSFTEASSFHESLIRIKGEKTPTITIGNKSDLETQRQISQKEGQELAKKSNSVLIETSAKTGQNVSQCFEDIARKVRDWKQALKAKSNENQSKTSNTLKKKKRRCQLI